MRENQQSISLWATTTFGDSGSDLRVAVRAQEEFVEFMRSYSVGKPDAMELADTIIVLCRLADRVGVDMDRLLRSPYGASTFSHLIEHANYTMSNVVIGCHMKRQISVHLCALVTTLVEIASSLGHDVWRLIDEKMVINRRREWKVQDGHGYHVRQHA